MTSDQTYPMCGEYQFIIPNSHHSVIQNSKDSLPRSPEASHLHTSLHGDGMRRTDIGKIRDQSYQVSTFQCTICSDSYNDQFKFFEHLKLHYEQIVGIGGEKTPLKTSHNNCATAQSKSLTSSSSKVAAAVKKDQHTTTRQHTITTTTVTVKVKQPIPYQHSSSDVAKMSCPKCDKSFKKSRSFKSHLERCFGSVHEEATRDRINTTATKNKRSKLESTSLSEKSKIPSEATEYPDIELKHEEIQEDYDDTGVGEFNVCFNEDELEEEETEMMYFESNICPSCDKQCETKENLERHIQVAHPEVLNIEETKIIKKKKNPGSSKKPDVLKCQQCQRIFNHRNSLVYHLRSHTGERPHKCGMCGKRFFATSALKVHMRLHSGEKPYNCKHCGRDFRQWGDLKYHIISIHSDVRQYQCEFCGKDFARKYSLIVHRRIHTNERNYKCEFCTKCFRAASYLQNHRRIHTGEKPHSCTICGKPFRVRSDMKRHMVSHSREIKEVPQVNVVGTIHTIPAVPISIESSPEAISVVSSLEASVLQQTNVSQQTSSNLLTTISGESILTKANSPTLSQHQGFKTAHQICLPIPVVSQQSTSTMVTGDTGLSTTAINIALGDALHSTGDILQNGVTTLQAATVVQEGMTIYQDSSSNLEILTTEGSRPNTVVLLPLSSSYIRN